ERHVATGSSAAIDRSVIEGLLATMGSPFIAGLIDTFREDARELVATLHRFSTAADLDGFRRAAPSLKSTSEALGAHRLAAIAQDVGTLARAGTIDCTGERIEQLAAEREIVPSLLEEIRRGIPA